MFIQCRWIPCLCLEDRKCLDSLICLLRRSTKTPEKDLWKVSGAQIPSHSWILSELRQKLRCPTFSSQNKTFSRSAPSNVTISDDMAAARPNSIKTETDRRRRGKTRASREVLTLHRICLATAKLRKFHTIWKTVVMMASKKFMKMNTDLAHHKKNLFLPGNNSGNANDIQVDPVYFFCFTHGNKYLHAKPKPRREFFCQILYFPRMRQKIRAPLSATSEK